MLTNNALSDTCINYLTTLVNQTYAQYNSQHPDEPLKLLTQADIDKLIMLANLGSYEQIYCILEDWGSNIIYHPAYWSIADLIAALPEPQAPIAQYNYTFTKAQLLTIINNWPLEPLTQGEHNYLLNFINGTEQHTYTMDDPESLLLEYLSDYEGD